MVPSSKGSLCRGMVRVPRARCNSGSLFIQSALGSCSLTRVNRFVLVATFDVNVNVNVNVRREKKINC